MGHLSHFAVYTLAMLSVIGIALFVYKKFSMVNFSSRKSNLLRVEDLLSLSPRKTLYVINANGEKFLIAGDLDRTTLISKLEQKEQPREPRKEHAVDLSEFIQNEDVLYSSSEKEPVMKNLVKKLGREIK